MGLKPRPGRSGYDEDLAERVRRILGPRTVEKKMFGGLCFMVKRHMCCGIVDDLLMVRVGPEQWEDALAQPHARPMDFTGKPMRGFVYVDPAGTTNGATLTEWIDRGRRFVDSLPAR